MDVGVGVGCQIQLTEFSVPLRKYSLRPRQGFSIISSGISMLSEKFFGSTLSIILCQIGAAPVIPDAKFWLIGLLSLFPTQEAARIDGVYPIVQLSLLLSVVPVLTETICPGILRGEL